MTWNKITVTNWQISYNFIVTDRYGNGLGNKFIFVKITDLQIKENLAVFHLEYCNGLT